MGTFPSKTPVRQICIDQSSGQVMERREWQRTGSSPTCRRPLFSSIGDRLMRPTAKEASRIRLVDPTGTGKNQQTRINELQRQLMDTERQRAELEKRVRALERNGLRGTGELILPNSIDQPSFCGRELLEAQLARRERELEGHWAKLLALEREKRKRLEKIMEERLGILEVDKLMEKMGAEGEEEGLGNGPLNQPVPDSDPEKRTSECAKEEQPQWRRESDNRPTNTPPARISTTSTVASAREEIFAHSHSRPIFRPTLNLRRNLGSGGKSAVELEGICLAEELEEEEDGPQKQNPIEENGRRKGAPPRLSTSAKSRDSGISHG